MCGIIGYIGKENKSINVLLKGLKNLEYRGYDSAGMALKNNKEIEILKAKGKIKNLEDIAKDKNETNLGIGHTRWATHGEATEINAHPHQVGNVTIVHNGIIENYEEIKKELLEDGYKFKSETDTEIACALIDKLYNMTNDKLKALRQFSKKAKGSYALGILFSDDNKLYAMRKDSPLIIGVGKDENYIASDVPAILEFTNNYILLEKDEFAVLEANKVCIYDNELKEIKKEIKTYEASKEVAMKNGFEHFMIKEINDEPDGFEKLISQFDLSSIDSLKKTMPDFSKYEKIDIVGCGSAYHTGLVAKSLFEEYAHVETLVEVASEYRYKENFYDKNTLVIVISQSGETADTLASLEKAKQDGIDTLAIVNREDSSIARMADRTLYIQAGIEVAVATTKAYSAQVMLLAILALKYAYDHNRLSEKELEEYLSPSKEIHKLMEKELKETKKISFIKKVSKRKDIFFIGRKIDYALSMEGSLKLKEISYINAVSYQAGELKHGTISLIEKGTPVFAIITDDDIYDKTISNIKEVKARGAYVICITNTKVGKDCYDEIIKVEKTNKFFQALVSIIPLQVIAYETAKSLGCDIDKPRNLAKSVTVE